MGKNEKHGRIKCWEFMGCGREEGGKNEKRLGICPAYPNNGRFCWCIAGTLCDGKINGTFAVKKQHCIDCEFFSYVRKQEGNDFKLIEID